MPCRKSSSANRRRFVAGPRHEPPLGRTLSAAYFISKQSTPPPAHPPRPRSRSARCAVCRMNVHPECRATPCSDDHRCRPPESVQISSGVDGSRLLGVRLKPGYPGANKNGVGIGGVNAHPVEDPLNSDWHQQLVGRVSCSLFRAAVNYRSLLLHPVRFCVCRGWARSPRGGWGERLTEALRAAGLCDFSSRRQ